MAKGNGRKDLDVLPDSLRLSCIGQCPRSSFRIEMITLRPVSDSDREFLARVYASTRADELALSDWSDAQKVQFCAAQFAAQDIYYRQHYPTAAYTVIQCNEVAAGRLYVDRWEREIRIMDITLLPEHRRGGIGTKLLGDLQAEAASVSKVLSIHVEKFNPALALYRRLGFQLREDKGVYLLMEWSPIAQS